jgi:hypothetical protein
MTNVKTLGAAMALFVVVATPVFAKEHRRAYARHRGACKLLCGRTSFAIPDPHAGQNIENFGFSGRDQSPMGDGGSWLHPGDLNPPGN